MTEPASPTPWRRPLLFGMILALLAFMAGTAVVRFEWFPHPQFLKPAFSTLQYRSRRRDWLRGKADDAQWQPVRSTQTGVVRHDPEQSHPGYTFFTTADGKAARLIDMEGTVVHEWSLPFEKAFPNPDKELPPLRHVYWRCARLFPNGDVLAMYVGAGLSPWGLGLVKVDRNSNILWTYGGRTHHDLHIDDRGYIHVLVHETRDPSDDPIPGHPEFESPIVDDYAVLLSPDGTEKRRISITDAIANSPFTPILRPFLVDGRPEWDLLHTNGIVRVTEPFATHHPFVEPGQLLLSLRNLHALALLDPKTERVVWLDRAYWSLQHDPVPLPNGNLLLFDNLGHMGPGDQSRVIEFNPATNALVWQYAGTEAEPFFSPLRGTQHPLPNENVLITDSESGRILEVTRTGAIVWEYYNPIRKAGKKGELTSVVLFAIRYDPDALPFLKEREEGRS